MTITHSRRGTRTDIVSAMKQGESTSRINSNPESASVETQVLSLNTPVPSLADLARLDKGFAALVSVAVAHGATLPQQLKVERVSPNLVRVIQVAVQPRAGAPEPLNLSIEDAYEVQGESFANDIFVSNEALGTVKRDALERLISAGRIGKGSVFLPGAHLEDADFSVGERCVIAGRLRRGVVLGNSCTIGTGSHISGGRLGDHVVCGRAVVAKDCEVGSFVQLGDGTTLNQVTIVRGVVIGKECALDPASVGENTSIGDHCIATGKPAIPAGKTIPAASAIEGMKTQEFAGFNVEPR